MLAQFYYVVRSPRSGEYLVAHPTTNPASGFLLLFAEHHEALSYLNAHGAGAAGQVESMATTALSATLKRWQLEGVGVVQDPLVPHIQFLRLEPGVSP